MIKSVLFASAAAVALSASVAMAGNAGDRALRHLHFTGDKAACARVAILGARGMSGSSCHALSRAARRGPAPAHNASAAQVDATYTVLHDFAGGAGDGSESTAEVTLDGAGNIYGTTGFGGAGGSGTIFQLAPDGTLTLLHSFSGSDGADPDSAVSLVHGNFFGTTESGGANENGVLYKLTSKGKYKILHDFTTDEGQFLRGRLLRDKLGNFYGAALFGGANGDGTVFKYASDGTLTVLHTFNGTDGEFPEHGLVSDAAGDLFGVTAFGGASDEGTVYEIDSGGTFSTVYSFTGGTDGGFLYGSLDTDKDGNLYGSTADGGANAQGTVFKLTPEGTLTTLYNFTGGADGGSPEGNMLRAGKNLYSVTTFGGDPTCQCGAIYEVKASGKEKTLHAFTGADGGFYSAGLTKQGPVFYGTTGGGGGSDNGVVFSVTKK